MAPKCFKNDVDQGEALCTSLLDPYRESYKGFAKKKYLKINSPNNLLTNKHEGPKNSYNSC